MAIDISLKASNRSVLGKKVRRLRREGWIPGVAYGPGMESLPIQVAQKEFSEVFRQVGTSALIGLRLEERAGDRAALIREVQRDPISQEILHVDIELVDLERPITTQVPIVLTGTSLVVDQGQAVLTYGVEEIEIRCLPTAVPAHVEVDLSAITRLEEAIHVSDLQVPAGVLVLTDPDTVVAYTTPIRRAEEEVVEEVEAVEAEGAETEES